MRRHLQRSLDKLRQDHAGLGYLLLIMVVAGGCRPTTSGEAAASGSDQAEAGEQTMELMVKSTAFEDGQTIPTKYTEDGDDVSPPLMWSGIPATAKSLALICDDPDAPREEPWVHWLIYDLPASVNALPEGVPGDEDKLSDLHGARQGKNSWGTLGYRGPAPPAGTGVHHYHFKLFALDEDLDLKGKLKKEELLKKIEPHVVARGELIGTYQRRQR